ncbi:MAG: rhomboid family intramembrane serine protease [Planctomycetota bacterium]|nr:rhomboid family intramembrane serine protease [Planctomycetota bacterium]
MGLYDRNYARATEGPQWLAPRGWTFNMWIIAVNVAVFLLNFLISPSFIKAVPLVPVYQGTALLLNAQRQPVAGNQPLVGEGPLFMDTGLSRPASLRDLPVNAPVYQASVIRGTNTIVGHDEYRLMRPLDAYGHFSTFTGFQKLEVWRLVTFQFLHAGPMHIFFNMLGLWVFGPIVENRLGGKRYLAFYLTCGIFGGLTYLFLNLVGKIVILNAPGLNFIPGLLFHDTTVPLVGASAGVFGVIMACAKIEPNTVVQLLFPPIPLKLRWMAYIYFIMAAANLLFGGNNAGGDAAHIGGAIAGFFFIRNSHLLMDFFDVFGDSRPGKAKPSRGRTPGNVGPTARENAEVDRILAKVATQGLHSLTEDEKATLARSTQRSRDAG